MLLAKDSNNLLANLAEPRRLFDPRQPAGAENFMHESQLLMSSREVISRFLRQTRLPPPAEITGMAHQITDPKQSRLGSLRLEIHDNLGRYSGGPAHRVD